MTGLFCAKELSKERASCGSVKLARTEKIWIIAHENYVQERFRPIYHTIGEIPPVWKDLAREGDVHLSEWKADTSYPGWLGRDDGEWGKSTRAEMSRGRLYKRDGETGRAEKSKRS
jgi:hypothetical protein